MIEEGSESKITSFTDLKAWQESRRLAALVYKITSSFPRNEVFGLSSQMQRAAVSTPSNIAEGFGRLGAKEKNQFYHVAKGSLCELETQTYIALDCGYLDMDNLKILLEQNHQAHRLLQGLIKANKSRI